MTSSNAIKLIVPLFLLVGISVRVNSQGLTTSDLLKAWDISSKMVIESAKAMPAEYFSYSPGEPLRNFADQLNHTSRSNVGFGDAVNAGKPDFKFNKNKPPQDKEATVALLENSFAYFRGGLAKLTNAQLSEKIGWGPSSNRRQITRLKAFTFVFNHVHSEHGKTIMYLRAKGIAPAPSGSWSFE